MKGLKLKNRRIAVKRTEHGVCFIFVKLLPKHHSITQGFHKFHGLHVEVTTHRQTIQLKIGNEAFNALMWLLASLPLPLQRKD